MMKLKSLTIRKYRNVKPGTELRFDDGINVLLGRNGTGKTTLLELISLVVRGDFQTIRGQAFDLEYVLSAAENQAEWTAKVAVRSTPQKRPTIATTGISIETPASTLLTDSSFEITLTGAGHTDQIRLPAASTPLEYKHDDEDWRTLNHPISLFDSRLLNSFLFVLHSITKEDPFHQPGPGSLSLLNAAPRFDEALEYFLKIVATKVAATIHHPGNSLASSYKLELPIDVAFAAIQLFSRDQADLLRIKKENLPLLANIAKTLGFANVDLLAPLHRASPQETNVGPFQFELTKRDEISLQHDDLSFGEKRMLALFWYLAANPSTLIADELVNGLHHEWIVTALSEIGQRQAFIASQNPLLLDYLEFTSAEQAATRFIQCRSELHDIDATTKREEFVWSNMSSEDATRFFSAYEVGIQHVGEILRTEGLW